ncbi:TetR/AcrR family transcriptional regulator [Sphingomonas sp. BIUV-7]|uniref:TetR/AcrR family transcriptional regulator n=1 Tax=Sphingomonas natans TaxID=3063330 RepID=A0ABT8Y8D7_9SPHN|nr:TetR/AcrR family transcriptional regulator [Sphingomonas sp. BIUV-7]MDO6414592.1 TetR/AcrR family transcriptional regulator [Sphingomonas sp. BIUV-7]
MLKKTAIARRQAEPAPAPGPARGQAGRPTTAELERRKANVMEVATQLFVAQGYAETSLVDIAKRSGVATRTLYQHFGDKEAIFREVVFARRVAALMPPSEPDRDASLFDALLGETKELLQYVLDPHSVDVMRLMVAESRRFPDLMKKVANATFARVLNNITHVFTVLAEDGQIPADDHATSARLFVDLILGNTPIMVYTHWHTIRPSTSELERKIELFIAGRFGPRIAKASRTKPKRRPRAQGAAQAST